MSEQLEIETKYEVDEDTPAPDLSAADGVARTTVDEVFHLAATYYDTEVLDLARHRITLRRRVGGKDDGWHLKLPAGADRREVSAPLFPDDPTAPAPGDGVPAELAARVLVYTRGRVLAPVAIVENDRHTTYAWDTEGTLLGELADDHVHTVSLLDDGVEKAWREWEFEVPDTDAGRVAARTVDRFLRAAGGRSPHSASKLARAIDSDPAPVEPTTVRKPTKAAASELLVAALAGYRDRLTANDPLVRARADDALHQMRVATRQLRSALTEFSAYFSGPAPAALSSELRSLASVLGGVRDAEVLAERFSAQAEAEPELAAAVGLLAAEQRRREAAGWSRVDAYLSADRYFALLDAVDATIAEPPLAKRAARPAVSTLAPMIHRRIRGFARDADDLLAAPDATNDDVHAIRKRAKRLRYAAAVAEPVLGKAIRAEIVALAAVQTRLGEFQDAAIARDAVAEVDLSGVAPATAFQLGRLDAVEERRAADARASLPTLLRRLG
ncbi:CYTH and CHAD domain-containing protein [Tsukamurella soli]|uniref:CHAD domain-containing protein n=1 Tax=Tsukamurella soli TaxID=644556 RepID=A0ABP8JR30_9ACTN